jgi:uncharacterized protein YndB with AHSA1/START domain
MRRQLIVWAAITLASTSAQGHSDGPASSGSAQASVKTDPVMVELSRLAGGAWCNDDPLFRIENRYEWAFGGTAIRGSGLIGKGSPTEVRTESFLGWDPVGKSVFYLDCHGGTSVYQGTVKKDGDDLIFEFATMVGQPSRWREVARFTDDNTLAFTMYRDREGKWSPAFSQVLKRKTRETSQDRLVTEGVVEAPIEAVWAALCTKEGLESWNVAHAEVDLRVGGLMRTHYDPKGQIGDPNTIENRILSLEPLRMLSIQVAKPPEKFPFKTSIKSVWQVIHFEPVGPTRTSVKIVGLGYSTDPESTKLREFFDKGNAYTLKKLQERFTAKSTKPASRG